MLYYMGRTTNTDTRRALAANVRHLMEKHGDNQVTLAKRAGVAQSAVSYALNVDRHVRLDTVEAIASAYGLRGWHLINPDLPTDLVDSPTLRRLLQTYIATSPEGRRMIDAVAEREAEYSTKKPA